MDGTALGDFLRTRRGKLKPADVDIISYGVRRVPGLRRENSPRSPASASPTTPGWNKDKATTPHQR